MTKLGQLWRVYVIPAAVFQSLMIGGGYGTGREIIEFFSRYGIFGGFLGLVTAIGCFAVLLATTYEFARVYSAYDYRRFFRELLGRGWIAFEIVYLVMFALVLAVVAAASGTLVEQYVHLPGAAGVAILLVLVIVFAFYGREWVTRILAYKALFLCLVFGVFFGVVVLRSGHRIAAEFSQTQIVAGWAGGALRYVLYSSVVAPTMLFATRAIQSRTQALVSGVTSAVFGLIPAILLHATFATAYPGILERSIPAYSMISELGIPALTVAYLVVLFGSLFDVGIGFIQSVNERIDSWSVERLDRKITRRTRALIALLCLIASGGLSSFGIVRLIAQGYGTMAYGFLLLFAGPLMTIGIYRLRRHGAVAS